jgi:hypothetical protein
MAALLGLRCCKGLSHSRTPPLLLLLLVVVVVE